MGLVKKLAAEVVDCEREELVGKTSEGDCEKWRSPDDDKEERCERVWRRWGDSLGRV